MILITKWVSRRFYIVSSSLSWNLSNHRPSELIYLSRVKSRNKLKFKPVNCITFLVSLVIYIVEEDVKTSISKDILKLFVKFSDLSVWIICRVFGEVKPLYDHKYKHDKEWLLSNWIWNKLLKPLDISIPSPYLSSQNHFRKFYPQSIYSAIVLNTFTLWIFPFSIHSCGKHCPFRFGLILKASKSHSKQNLK